MICPDRTFITGFRLKQERRQQEGDDSAANGFQAYCSGPGLPEGRWSAPVFTKPGYAVDAVRVKIECSQGDGDDTGLNNVGFEGRPVAGQ